MSPLWVSHSLCSLCQPRLLSLRLLPAQNHVMTREMIACLFACVQTWLLVRAMSNWALCKVWNLQLHMQEFLILGAHECMLGCILWPCTCRLKAELSCVLFIWIVFIRRPCLSILWFLHGQHFCTLCNDWWAFSVQGAAPCQNALLPKTRGDRKPGPERAWWGRLQVRFSDIRLEWISK